MNSVIEPIMETILGYLQKLNNLTASCNDHDNAMGKARNKQSQLKNRQIVVCDIVHCANNHNHEQSVLFVCKQVTHDDRMTTTYLQGTMLTKTDQIKFCFEMI